jgi:hypothetical protein
MLKWAFWYCVSNNKDLHYVLVIFRGFEHKKTKPIQSQSYLAPELSWDYKPI